MCDAPALRNIERELLRQCCGSLARDGISPGAERNQKLPLLIERHIAVHHSRKSDGTKLCDGNAVFVLYILCHLAVAVPKTVPDHIQAVRPDSVDQLILPVVRTGCDRLMCLVHQHCLDSGRAELDTEHRLPTLNPLLCISHV